jgi:hypothetical protein
MTNDWRSPSANPAEKLFPWRNLGDLVFDLPGVIGYVPGDPANKIGQRPVPATSRTLLWKQPLGGSLDGIQDCKMG